MLMLDLCCGLKGASAVMAERGWEVVTVDIEERFSPDVVADVRAWSWRGRRPDLIWASPPCTEFSREFMPWCRTGVQPDLSIVRGCYRIIQEAQPRYWIIENVRGAVPYLGKASAHYGPFFLWGFFPSPGPVDLVYKKKESYSSSKPEERARIPRALSAAIAGAVESSSRIFDWCGYPPAAELHLSP